MIGDRAEDAKVAMTQAADDQSALAVRLYDYLFPRLHNLGTVHMSRHLAQLHAKATDPSFQMDADVLAFFTNKFMTGVDLLKPDGSFKNETQREIIKKMIAISETGAASLRLVSVPPVPECLSEDFGAAP